MSGLNIYNDLQQLKEQAQNIKNSNEQSEANEAQAQELEKYNQELADKKASEEFTNALNDKANQEAFLKYKAQQSGINTQTQGLDSLLYADEKAQTEALKAQTQKQNTQIIPNEDEAMLQEAQRPKRYRNTGVAYFDNKDNLTIADAFLAKQLGLNISYIDMNLNANIKTTDVGRAKNELASLFADSKSLLDGTVLYEDTYKAQGGDGWFFGKSWGNFKAQLGRKLNSATNGLINPSSNANEKILSRNKLDTYTMASLMNGGAGKRTNQNIKDAGEVIDNTWKGRENYYAGVVSGLENGLNYMNEKITYMENAGIPLSKSDTLKLYLLNEMKKDLTQAQKGTALSANYKNNVKAMGILNEKGDKGIAEAMKLIYNK